MTPKILIVFYSRGGSVEKLARAIAEGAQSTDAEVRLRRARELVSEEIMAAAPGWRDNAERMNSEFKAPSAEDADWADGIAFGAPTRFGSASSELRAFIETLGPLWIKGTLFNKAGTVFSSSSAPYGGLETTIFTLYPTLVHLGFVIVPAGYGDPVMFRAGTPYGAGSVSHGAQQLPPGEDDLAAARYQGRRVAAVAGALKAIRSSN
jgi:NAD(P)H dehydrogenase (quinone)